jgi:glucose/arabinose dehydrogenase
VIGRSAYARFVIAFALLAGCSGGGGSQVGPPSGAPTASPGITPTPSPTPHEGGATTPSPTPTGATPTPAGSALPGMNDRLYFPNGTFYGNTIAQMSAPRELVALPNGDLLAGTTTTSQSGSSTVELVPDADATGSPGAPVAFATIADHEAQGLAYSPVSGSIYVATTNGVWEIPYHTGDRVASAAPVKIVSVRTGSIAPNSDGDVHTTTSVTVSGNFLYIGVGSSCNRCTEVDPTRAVVLRTDLSGNGLTTVATRFRNPIALAVNPATGVLWAGGAGQDCLEPTIATSCAAQNNAYENGHPFEFIDPVTTHAAPADYGWPDCEEDHTSYVSPAADCSGQIAPAVTAPAYSTIIGATFYPAGANGAFAFPSTYGGGLFMTFHGSWHENANGVPISTPNLVFVPLSGDAPVVAMNWTAMDPSSQWSAFVEGWQDPAGTRYGRPTGLAVGPLGSLFVADDMNGAIYRIRPGSAPAAKRRR